MFSDLKNKIALITGSSRGIGFATAKTLQEFGVIVILNSNSSEEELKKASAEMNNAEYYRCDITKDEKVKEMVSEVIKKHGHIDLLVNNAGGGGWASVMDPDEEWQKSFDLDLMGTVHISRYVIPHMKTGAIVNISSMWGINGTAKPSITSYCTMKAAMVKLTECLAREYAPNIRVNSVAPGWTETKMLEDNMDEKGMEFMKRNILLGRTAKPEEIAKAVVFLLSEEASYITGQTLPVDGGYILNREHIA